MATCRSCGQPVRWLGKLLPAGKPHPLIPEPGPTGNIRLIGPRGVVGQVVPKSELEAERAKGALFTSHFATCEHAAQHRKARS